MAQKGALECLRREGEGTGGTQGGKQGRELKRVAIQLQTCRLSHHAVAGSCLMVFMLLDSEESESSRIGSDEERCAHERTEGGG